MRRAVAPHCGRQPRGLARFATILLLAAACTGCGGGAREPEHPGKAVYQRHCYACHQAGIADAPKLGDKEAWAPRLSKTHAELLRSVLDGMVGMPPRGACASCSDEDLEAAVDFMVVRAQ